MDVVVLGAGILNWHPDERRTDRYGTVHLNHAARPGTPTRVAVDTAPVGTHGHLVAVITGTRPSTHLGGLLRGLGPAPAPVGVEVTLGTGTLFVESSRDGATEIGLRPDEHRPDNWLDPTALYRCHDQIVRLELRPDRLAPDTAPDTATHHDTGPATVDELTHELGLRVELVHTNDPYTQLRPGDQGTTVGYYPPGQQLYVAWDSGSWLAMLLDEGDQVRIVRPHTTRESSTVASARDDRHTRGQP